MQKHIFFDARHVSESTEEMPRYWHAGGLHGLRHCPNTFPGRQAALMTHQSDGWSLSLCSWRIGHRPGAATLSAPRSHKAARQSSPPRFSPRRSHGGRPLELEGPAPAPSYRHLRKGVPPAPTYHALPEGVPANVRRWRAPTADRVEPGILLYY